MDDLFTYRGGSLAEARAAWQKTIAGDGGHCPCCDRWGKVYGRAINRTMLRSLIWLNHQSLANPPAGWVDVPRNAPRWLVRSNQLPTLRWWGLVERMEPCDDPDIKHSGIWRTTPLANQFIHDGRGLPRKVFTYNGEPVDFSNEVIHIWEIAEFFSYAEIMSENWQ